MFLASALARVQPISIRVFRETGQIHADKWPGPGGLAGPDISCGSNGFPWRPQTRDPSARFCITQSGVFTIFDIAQIVTPGKITNDEASLSRQEKFPDHEEQALDLPGTQNDWRGATRPHAQWARRF